MISKKGHSRTQEVYKGQQIKYKNYKNQENQENDWFRKLDNQYNKVLKKNNLRSSIDLSLSTKHLLFLSLQRNHIKWWITNNIRPFRWQPSLPCQQARSPIVDCDITQLTPNKPKTIDHKSIAIGQWRKRWSIDSHYTCTYNTNPISKTYLPFL